MMVIFTAAFAAAGCDHAVKPPLAAANMAADTAPIPTADQIVSCQTDAAPAHAHDLAASVGTGCRDLAVFLADAHAVGKRRWLHGYSHVALMDRSGRILLRDGRTLRWMLRPGGLGYLEDARGGRTYLVGCKC